jgi:hypothetical protein
MLPPPRPPGKRAPPAPKSIIRSSVDPKRTETDLRLLHRVLAEKIEQLPANERFKVLSLTADQHHLDASSVMTFDIMDNFDRGVEANLQLTAGQMERLMKGEMQPKLREATLAERRVWTISINYYLWEIQEWANLTFDTQVWQHIQEQVAGLQGFPKLLALSKDATFPLFAELQYKQAYRNSLEESVPYDMPFAFDVVGKKSRDYNSYVSRARVILAMATNYIRYD